MDTYQYALVKLGHGEWVEEEPITRVRESDGHKIYVKLKWRPEILSVEIFDKTGKSTLTEEEAGKHSYTERTDLSDTSRHSWTVIDGWWSEAHPLEVMAPVFARLGSEGWEVVEYKFSNNYHTNTMFAQALLKRMVQKD